MTVWRFTATGLAALALIGSASGQLSTAGGETAFVGTECLTALAAGPVRIEYCLEEFLRSTADKNAWTAFLRGQRERIYYSQDTGEFRIHGKPPKVERPLSAEPQPSGRNTLETPLVIRELAFSREVPYLSSGGWLNVVTLHPFLEGHYDVTLNVLRDQFRFDYAAQLVAADAAQDPDFYAWKKDAAHAQTPVTSAGTVMRPEDRRRGESAVGDFIGWMADHVTRLRSHCEDGDVLYAIYRLGYGLHAIQDLAAHNGRTSAEHAWNSYCHQSDCGGARSTEEDPDKPRSNIERAYRYSITYLRNVDTLVGDACWSRMRQYSGRPMTLAEKRRLLDGGRDLTWAEYRAYKASARVFATLADRGPHVVRWIDGSRPFQALIDELRRKLGA
jgi:hypothetical protein